MLSENFLKTEFDKVSSIGTLRYVQILEYEVTQILSLKFYNRDLSCSKNAEIVEIKVFFEK